MYFHIIHIEAGDRYEFAQAMTLARVSWRSREPLREPDTTIIV